MTVQPLGQGPLPSSAPPTPVKDPSVMDNQLTVLHTVQPRDSVAIGANPSKASTYTREDASGERARAEHQQVSALLRRMAEKLITEQYEKGNHLFQLLYGGTAVQLDPQIRAPQIAVDNDSSDQIIARAQEMVGENGYYGVAQTGARIVEFTKALSGEDSAKADFMRRSVEEAFMGLNDTVRHSAITSQTFKAVNSGFDSWVSEKPASTPAPAPASAPPVTAVVSL